MPTATLGEVRIAYSVAGAGDPTVLVHGSLVDRSSWDAVVPGLVDSLKILTYDRRGHGESTGPVRSHPVREDADDLARLLEAIDLYPVHVIAHSYAGAVALKLAAERPEMVRSLGIHEPPFVGLLEDDPATAPEAERLRTGTRAILDLVRAGRPEPAAREIVNAFSVEAGAWERLRPEAQRGMLRYVDRWAEELSDPEATQPDRAVLAELLIPALLTTGEKSPPFVQRITHLLAGQLRNSTLRTLPGVAHTPQRSHPDMFIALLHGFLVERDAPSN